MAKKYVVIDTEFHHIPWEAGQKAKGLPDGDLKFRRIVETPDAAYKRVFDIEGCVRHMEECGIDMALIGLATWTDSSLDVCKSINDGQAKLMKEYPGRFIPLACIPVLDGQPAIDELDRAITELGLKGVTITTSLRGVPIDDPQYTPFFKKVSRLGIPVVVHPTVKIPVWGGVKYNMSGSVSREYEIIKAFVEALCGILPEFPDLKFLFSHYGGGVPFLLARIKSWYIPPGPSLIPENRRTTPKTMREFEDFGLKKDFDKLLDRFHFNMAGTGGWITALKQALMVLKPERICFGSDYPWEMARSSDLKAFINGVKRLDIPEKDKINILGGNVMRLFKVS
jgi:predicted TIM-barrel fold metal-dependent hydrolase